VEKAATNEKRKKLLIKEYGDIDLVAALADEGESKK
jgi:hypothetical protein